MSYPLDQVVLVGAYPEGERLRTNLCTHFCIGQRRDKLEALLARCAPDGPCPPGG